MESQEHKISLPIDLPMDEIVQVCRRYHVRELALFGSVLRSDFSPDSDLDILVEFEEDAAIGLLEYAGMAHELSDALGRRVDLVEKAGLKRRIRKPVIESARVIYAG